MAKKKKTTKKMAKPEGTAEQKDTASRVLKLALDQINGVKRGHTPDSIKIGSLGQMKALNHPALPTGSLSLDLALGIGGYARGRLIEIWGLESSGKTTLAIEASAQMQKLGERVAFIDLEHTLDPTYCQALGVNIDDLLLAQPDSGDEAMDTIDILVNTGEVGLIVVDSVAALTPKEELEGNVSDNKALGLQARLMSKALRKFTQTCDKTNTTVLFINQIRSKIVMFGNPNTTTGGNALKFYASQRIELTRRDPIKLSNETVGAVTRAKVVKNKLAPPFREAYFRLMYGEGIDNVADVVSAATEVGVIEKAGAWLKYEGENIGQGLDNTVKMLREQPDIVDEIRKKTLIKVHGEP